MGLQKKCYYGFWMFYYVSYCLYTFVELQKRGLHGAALPFHGIV